MKYSHIETAGLQLDADFLNVIDTLVVQAADRYVTSVFALRDGT